MIGGQWIRSFLTTHAESLQAGAGHAHLRLGWIDGEETENPLQLRDAKLMPNFESDYLPDVIVRT